MKFDYLLLNQPMREYKNELMININVPQIEPSALNENVSTDFKRFITLTTASSWYRLMLIVMLRLLAICFESTKHVLSYIFFNIKLEN